ncbi:MAG: 7-carboxy-7-deazaguanine synthase QueE [Planctomycetota bacterium]
MTTPAGKGDIRYGNVHSVFASIQGEGPKVGELHLFVRLYGCDVGCEYCDTPDALGPVKDAIVSYPACDIRQKNPMSTQQLADICRKFANENPLQGIAVTGGEPLLQAEYVRDFLRDLGRPRPPVILETSGLHPDNLDIVAGEISAVSADFKLASTRVAGADEAKTLCFLAKASERLTTWVKLPIDYNVSPAEIRRVVSLISSTVPKCEIVLQPITHADPRADLKPNDLLKLFKTALDVRPSVRLIPQVHKFLGVK